MVGLGFLKDLCLFHLGHLYTRANVVSSPFSHFLSASPSVPNFVEVFEYLVVVMAVTFS